MKTHWILAVNRRFIVLGLCIVLLVGLVSAGWIEYLFSLFITVINVQSYPSVGGVWAVDFNTTGRADLTVTAINGTVWGKDLIFQGIWCGSVKQESLRVGDGYVVKDYFCDGVGREESKVLTTGKHTLKFQFGSEEAYAFNYAESDINCTGADFLSANATEYFICGQYYKAAVHKATGSGAQGLVRQLYIKNSTGGWSDNVIYEPTTVYGLGYLEGPGVTGIQHGTPTIIVTTNTTTKVVIRVNNTINSNDWIETWTFWKNRTYFVGEASANCTGATVGIQNQFASMIDTPNAQYGTDGEGDVVQYTSRKFQHLYSNVTFPFINYQFSDADKPVSLALIFTYVNKLMRTCGETGDYAFEHQINWDLGTGALYSPYPLNYYRKLTTIYYVTNSKTNVNVTSFASSEYNRTTNITRNATNMQEIGCFAAPVQQAPGSGCYLFNTPYSIIRQNTQWDSTESPTNQWLTEIYKPTYAVQSTDIAGKYSYTPLAYFSVNYCNDTTLFEYGNITSYTVDNTAPNRSAELISYSDDSKIKYNITYSLYSDSDKVLITGKITNNSALVNTKEIYVELKYNDISKTVGGTPFKEGATPQSAITDVLSAVDNKWTYYDYGWSTGKALIFKDNQENVPRLRIVNSDIVDGEYEVKAIVRRTPVDTTYSYSWDNTTWHNFTITAGGAGAYTYTIGKTNISGGVLMYIDDPIGNVNQWIGWGGLIFRKSIVSLNSTVYDAQYIDSMWGPMGQSVTVTDPTTVIMNNTDYTLKIYVFNNSVAQNLSGFEYNLSMFLFNHKEYFSNVSNVTALHSKETISYRDKDWSAVPEAGAGEFTLTLNATSSDESEIKTQNHSYQEAYATSLINFSFLEWDGTNETATVSGSVCYLNKTDLSDGNYSYRFYANDTGDNWSNTSTYWVVIDVGAPTVTLQEQWGSTKSTSIVFKYKPEDASNNITNCSLWGDFNGTWAVNQTDTTITAGTQNSFTAITLGNGTYSWNVICYDWNDQSAWGTENKTLIINTSLEGIQNGDFEDTTSWDYCENNENFTGAYHYFNGTYGFHMDYIGCCGDGRTTTYSLQYPHQKGYANTYNQITQNVTVPSGSDYTLSFVVRDSYYGGYIAQVFHWKQVYIDGVKVWEDDVYTQEGCQYVELNVTSYLSGHSTVNLTLRHWIHAGFSQHYAEVFWDNVTLLTSKPSRIQNGLFESSDYWKNTSDGNFTGQYNTSGANHEATEGVYDGKRSYEIRTNGTNTQGKYYSVNQTIKVPIVAESDPYRIRFWVKDDYSGSTANNYFKELLVDGSVVWRDDVKGSEASGDSPRGWNGWMIVNENVESNLRGKSTADISLRVYANSTTTFNVTVWFDAVEVYTGIDYWNRRLDNTRGALGGYAYYVSWNQYNMVGNNWNTFFHYISRSKWRWDNFTLFVNGSKGQMRVFACILPLSDEFGSPTGGSYPYHKNYLDWPKHLANMSKKYPNLRGMYIDDFGFEKHHVMQMMKNARAINPTFTLLPNQYYYVAAETRMEDLGTSLDGSSWCYRGLSGYGKSDASRLKNETLLTKKAYGEKLLIGHPYTTFVQDFNGTSYEQEQTYLWGDGSTPYILNGGIHLNAAGNLYRRVGEYESTAVGNGGFESTANWSNKTTNANFNLVYNSSIYFGGSKSLQMSFPASTALALDNYSEISQFVTLPLNSSRYRITGWARDDYNLTTNTGYWFKQIAVNGEVIWEDDVEDHESNVSGEKYPRWGWFNEDLTRYANETVNFTFRVYLKKDITDFGVNVWWDNITLIQTKTGLDNGDMEDTNASARETMWRFMDSKRYGMAYGSGAYGTHYYVGAFVDTDSNFTGTFSTTEKIAGTYSYKVTVSTIANNTDYAEISQVINIPLLNETWINVSCKDNITSGANNYTNQVMICYLNTTYEEYCMTLWSDDVDGNEGWQNISVRMDNATALGDRTVVEVILRTTANTNPSFPVATYWDAAEVYVPGAAAAGAATITLSGEAIDNTSIYINGSTKLNCSVTGTNSISVVKFYVHLANGTNINVSAVNGSGNEWYHICDSADIYCKTYLAGSYNFTNVWANDSVNNINTSTPSLQFNVSAAADVTSPVHTFHLSKIVPEDGSLTVEYQPTAGTTNISISSTHIGVLDGISPDSFNIPHTLLSATTRVGYELPPGTNVTQSNLTYTQYTGCDIGDYESCQHLQDVGSGIGGGLNLTSILLIMIAAGAIFSVIDHYFGGKI